MYAKLNKNFLLYILSCMGVYAEHVCTSRGRQNKVLCLPQVQHSSVVSLFATLYKSLSVWAEALNAKDTHRHTN